MSAVPWWGWLLAAAALPTGILTWFTIACARAPMDTDLWDGGEPGRGIRVNPGRPEGDL